MKGWSKERFVTVCVRMGFIARIGLEEIQKGKVQPTKCATAQHECCCESIDRHHSRVIEETVRITVR